jgi:hypothetical protein
MATTTIHKRIQFARQFMHDAVDWKIIDENPFCKVKTQKSSVKVNEFVPCFSPEGDTCLPVCVSHRTLVTTQPIYIFQMRLYPFQIHRI